MRGLLILLTASVSLALDKYLVDFPEPYTDHNRIHIQILNFDFHHIDSLNLNLNEILSMCEGGWDPTILIYSCANYSDTIMKYIVEKSFCYRTQTYIPIHVRQYDAGVGIWLSAPHRIVAKDLINNFDFFVYIEDDMIFRYTLLTAFLEETKMLQAVLPENGLADYCIGYQRFKKKHHKKGEYLDGENVIVEHVDELPTFDHICLQDIPYVTCHAVEEGVHQAMWSLTRQQILTLQDRCQYLDFFTGAR